MSKIVFTSALETSYQAELDRLLFFNANQGKVRTDVPFIIDRYGMARIKSSSDQLRIVFDSSPDPQSLFALERSDEKDSLVGVMVYVREGNTLSLVIAVVREDYADVRLDDRDTLLRQMLAVVRGVARRVKGVTSVTVFPGSPRARKLRVS